MAKIPTVNPFSENIAIADINGVKTVINAQGKTLMQDGKGLKLLGSKSSENAILALNPTNNKVGFVYNPLATDTLLFNFRKKGEQLYTIGIKFFNRKKYSQAKKCFESLLRHNTKDIKALIKYADCLTAQKYYAKAIYNYNKVLAIDSSNKDAQIKLHMAQKKKEQAEYTMALLQDIAGAVYNILDATNQALSSSQSSSESTNSSYTGKSNSHSSSTTGSTNRNDSNWRFSMMNTYADFENQLSKMNTYPETYNDNDRRYIQSRMKEIRSQLEKRGYSQRKSEWEDWDGKKK